jgi:AcrR family transcriptional regulator
MYRNFETKEAIIDEYIQNLYEFIMSEAAREENTDIFAYENAFQYIENFAGDMPQSSNQRYLLYYIAGAATNVLLKWLEDGAIETPHEITMTCADIMSSPLLKSDQDKKSI